MTFFSADRAVFSVKKYALADVGLHVALSGPARLSRAVAEGAL